VLALAEAFYAKLDGDDVRDETLAPMTPAQIAKIEQAVGVSVPDEVKAFWLRGFKQKKFSVEAPAFGTAGIDFLGAPHVARNTTVMRELELELDEDEDEDEDDEESVMARLHREGVALSHSEPHFVVDCGKETPGAIYRVLYDGTPLDVPVATSLTELLEHWLAAGCFTSHDYPSVWKRVKDHVPPLAIPAKNNKWLRFYDRQYKTKFAK
jgi:hypothetical protein